MSDNVNVLIEKMNQESMRKEKIKAKGKSIHTQVGIGSLAGDGGLVDNIGGEKRVNQSQLASQKPARAISHSGYSPKPGAASIGGVRGTIAEREVQIADKAIVNLMKEHNKLKKRLELVQQPDFLINLKRDLRTTEEEIKQ